MAAEIKLGKFFTEHCVQCHGPDEQESGVRLDQSINLLLADTRLVEKIIHVVEDGEMPPEEELQPPADLIDEIIPFRK